MEKLKLNHKKDNNALTEIERILTAEAQPIPEPAQEAKAPPVREPVPDEGLQWVKRPTVKAKTTVVSCIVIDKADRWHTGASVDLKGMDSAGFTWGYYGSSYPVLVENQDGELAPFYLPDAAGENSNRLFKGANPDGFRATFKHRSSILTKIQVGLMVALVLGLFFIVFILIGWK